MWHFLLIGWRLILNSFYYVFFLGFVKKYKLASIHLLEVLPNLHVGGSSEIGLIHRIYVANFQLHQLGAHQLVKVLMRLPYSLTFFFPEDYFHYSLP